MIISLPSGRCVEMSLDAYLSCTLEDLSDLDAFGYGNEILDPFHGSVLIFGEKKVKNYHINPLDSEEEEESEELLEDLLSIKAEVKRLEKDFLSEDQE